MIPAHRNEKQSGEVRKAGGTVGPIKALSELGEPAAVLLDTKATVFAA